MKRGTLIGIYVFLLLMCGYAGSVLAAAEVLRAPFPAWVEPITPDLSPTTPAEMDAAGGAFTLLHDRQIRVADDVTFTHRISRLLNPSGVEDYSRLLFEFEPSYQTLTLHRLRIHRDGAVIDYTDTQEIRIRERESDLESNLYNGYLSAEILLPEIRPGDLVEWAYSIGGGNPIFSGRYSDSWGLASFGKMRHYRVRIVLPEENQAAYVVTTSDNVAEEWITREGQVIVAELTNTEAWSDYPDAPSWFHPYPWIAVDEYADWSDVVNWAVPLYSELDTLPVALLPVRDRLAAIENPDARMVAALQHVQGSLRYISLSTGLHSHKPYAMADVIDRGFGDCKDNAQMLVALLRALGFRAWPALVSTDLQQTIADYHPTPNLFDHVVVMAETAAGKQIWLDPTDSFQAGPLDGIYIQPYGKAMLIREGETGLTDMPGGGLAYSKVTIVDEFVLPSEASEPVELKVKSVYEGWEADYMRYYLAGKSLRSLETDYADYYDELYGECEAVSPLEVEDDTTSNRVIIREHWRFTDPWQTDNEEDTSFLEFKPVFLDRLQDAPSSMRSERPYALVYPKNSTHIVRVHLPFPIPFSAGQFEKETPHFHFSFEDALQDNTIDIRYHFITKTPFVPWAELAEYKSALDEASNYGLYTLMHPWQFVANEEVTPETAAFVPGIKLILLANLGLALGLFLGIWESRSSGPPPLINPELPAQHKKLCGIGGWLILPCIGLILSIGMLIGRNVNEGFPNFDLEVWQYLTQQGSEGYHALWAPTILLAILHNSIFLGFIPVHLINFFRRKVWVPTGFICFYLANLLYLFVDMILSLLMPEALGEEVVTESVGLFFKALLASVIWILYFRKSLRVKLTFTRP